MTEENKALTTPPTNAIALRRDFDPDYTRSTNENILDTLSTEYFRSRFIGFDEGQKRVEPNRALIYASNHSGMAFPWDAIIFSSQILAQLNYELERMPRALALKELSRIRLMCPYLIDNFWKRCGVVDATTENFETMMATGDSDVLIYPEGAPGMSKGFNNRYQLQRFSSSFIRMAITHQTDIVPISTVNAEFINPWTYTSETVNQAMRKVGIPFLPLGLILIPLLLQPWIFYFAFPAKLTFVVGRRIKPYELSDKPLEEMSIDDFRAIAEQVRQSMQEDLHDAVQKYGQKPFELGEFLKKIIRKPSLLFTVSPFLWPIIFSEHDRLYKEKSAGEKLEVRAGLGSLVRGLVRNPFCIFFFIPILGWIPIALRGFKKILSKDSKSS